MYVYVCVTAVFVIIILLRLNVSTHILLCALPAYYLKEQSLHTDGGRCTNPAMQSAVSNIINYYTKSI